MENISKNITYAEAIHSSTAKREGIDNTPNQKELECMKLLAEKVFEPLREWVGGPIKVNSFFRSVALNEAIGGAASSQHCKGQAADIEVPGTPNAELAEWIVDNLDFDQVILEFYTPGIPDSGWVHVSYKADGENRKSILTAMKEDGKTVYKEGIIA